MTRSGSQMETPLSLTHILEILGVAAILYLIGSLRVLRQYERGVVFLTIAFPPAMWVDGTDLERVGGSKKLEQLSRRTILPEFLSDFSSLSGVNGIIPPSSKPINSGLVESVGRSRFRTGLSPTPPPEPNP
jgi:hypothetical protein